MNILGRSDLKIKDTIPYFEISEMAKLGWIRHGFLTREGGVSPSPYESLNLGVDSGDSIDHVSKNKHLIAQAFGFDPGNLILPDQIQKDRILILKESINTLPSLLEYDALITNAPDRFLGILTADCLPILVVDRRKRVIAAIHAGRPGTGLHITTKVLKKMKEEFDCSPDDYLIGLGPLIGPCCYEIDKKVFLPEWESFSMSIGDGKWMLDLATINIAQMKKEGVNEQQIIVVDLCTKCDHDLFFSYRKEGRTGRQLSFIGIIQPNDKCLSPIGGWENG